MRRPSLPSTLVALAIVAVASPALAQTGQPLRLGAPPLAASSEPASPEPASPVPASPLPGGLRPAVPLASFTPPGLTHNAPPRVPLPVPRPRDIAPPAPEPEAEPAALPPAPPPVPPPAPVQPAAADSTPAGILARANAALNAISWLAADFVQVGGNGRRVEGRLYLHKPGRLRFDYNPPATLEIVADGSSVVIRDSKLGTQDLYGIAQTPLKFLLKERLDLARDTKVIEVQGAPDLASVLLEDRATFGGTSRIELFFDPRTYALRQWVVVDPQGYRTQVNLKNVDLVNRPDPALFAIDYTKSMQNMTPATNR